LAAARLRAGFLAAVRRCGGRFFPVVLVATMATTVTAAT